jgi:hypothetical protein
VHSLFSDIVVPLGKHARRDFFIDVTFDVF